MEKWLIAFFAITGGFFLCGIGGALVAEVIGIWSLPVSGFCAAFGTVTLTNFSVPNKKEKAAVVVLLFGSVLAWLVLEPSSYPASYGERAYHPTHLPFLVTVAGGIFALLLCIFPKLLVKKGIYEQ